MNKISRREFLRSVSAVFGTAAAARMISACSPAQPTQIEAPATLEALNPTATRPLPGPTTVIETSPTNQQPTNLPSTEAPAGIADLIVVHGSDPQELVRRALASLGGIEKFISKGANVIIKPNICVAYHTYEYAATTNPWVVGALVKSCLDAGAAKVRVMDFPFGGTAEEAYKKSGIADEVLKAGGVMEVMQGFKFKKTEIPNGIGLKSSSIYEDALKADVLINVPIAKTHSLAGLTLGMKNLMGLIRSREMIHINLGQYLADLNSRIRPVLTFIDATRILTNNGPTGGNLEDVKKLDTLIVSRDVVSADSYACGVFGRKPESLDYLVAAAKMGLGRIDVGNLKIEEFSIN